MSDMKYSKDHEWLLMDDDGNATVGITDFAQNKLGDIVYVELPEIDAQFSKDDDIAVVESVKAASDVMSPASGTVIAVNDALEDEPEKVNSSPTDEGWFLKLKLDDPGEVIELMDEEAYNAFIADL
ncbi:MAG: glycine cleavage system protein GcvH [Gammaproteobacteria bacterium]|jgi:glycine cleavage system H protein